MTSQILWLPRPEAHDYDATTSYLDLILPHAKVLDFVDRLRAAPMTTFKAKDIFRASQLPLLGKDNSHVAKNLSKIQAGKSLSPILLVSDYTALKVHIADGYHRMCAVYTLSEDQDIPCQIVG
ncbi:hypothetical protein [Telmatospirillum siberiense]|uniref:ParB/Sulfiredoxin domain-containing protein n=1 Tax=Telmatospirillum siberiense TaxID=382514 RepID=A0A2N3PV32_9PROT|nr:hypothetical protein [Telmatospirillum siberiense]PKU24264.1 hypothetical protein CWS72_11730 [Telmatospirillum siberiense]